MDNGRPDETRRLLSMLRLYIYIMKEIRKVLLVYSLVAFVLALLVNMAVDSLLGTPPDWLETLLEAALYGLLAGAGLSWLTYSFLKPRLSFLTSGEREVPAFGGREARVIPVTAANFSFEVIKYRIREQRYIITYYDDVEQYIVKFRSRFGLRSWGIGGCVAYDTVAGTITLTCFPMSDWPERNARITQPALDKMEALVRGER